MVPLPWCTYWHRRVDLYCQDRTWYYRVHESPESFSRAWYPKRGSREGTFPLTLRWHTRTLRPHFLSKTRTSRSDHYTLTETLVNGRTDTRTVENLSKASRIEVTRTISTFKSRKKRFLFDYFSCLTGTEKDSVPLSCQDSEFFSPV